MYQLVIVRYAKKQLGKIPPPHFNRITKAINDLANNPRPHGHIKLTGRPGYRIRIGDYRVFITSKTKFLLYLLLISGTAKTFMINPLLLPTFTFP
jgi:mRNA interferase RelE/StbE